MTSGAPDWRPALVVIAGPNGSGKTELTTNVLGHEWLEGCEYVNPDNIARDRFGDWNSPKAVLEAARHATTIRRACLAHRRSLAFETVLSTEEKVNFVRDALAAGFFIRLFFVATNNPEINAARVLRRVAQGGHDVPNAKILSRYSKSIANLGEVLPLVHRGYVYDNSIDGASPALQFRTVSGSVGKVYRSGHKWADLVLDTLPRPDNRFVLPEGDIRSSSKAGKKPFP